MFLIAGLGNPGKKYDNTPHNIGFEIMDGFELSLTNSGKFEAHLAKTIFDEKQVILAKPQTFMNKSGNSVGKIKTFYKIPLKNILIIHDDVDLPLGKIRFSFNSRSGGHNGINSIIQSLGSKQFARLRIGVKQENQKKAKDFVLQPFSKDNKQLQEKIINKSIESIHYFLNHSINEVKNKYNGITIV